MSGCNSGQRWTIDGHQSTDIVASRHYWELQIIISPRPANSQSDERKDRRIVEAQS